MDDAAGRKDFVIMNVTMELVMQKTAGLFGELYSSWSLRVVVPGFSSSGSACAVRVVVVVVVIMWILVVNSEILCVGGSDRIFCFAVGII